MKTHAAVLWGHDRPLSIEEVELPLVRPGQVLVEISYSGVCHSQVMEARGRRGVDRYLPHLLGHEGSGRVVAVGEGVTKVAPDDTVVLTWIKGDGAECGGSQYLRGATVINAGAVTTLGEHAVVSENRCVRVPPEMPLDIAALLGCAVLTGSGIVLNTLRRLPGATIAIFGVGGIGLSAVMAAKLSGCGTIIAIDAHDVKLQMARAFGATHVVNAVSEDALARVREVSGPEGLDFAVEAAGRTSTIEMAFSAVKRNGGICVFASHPPAGEKISLDPFDLISGKTIKGSWGGESRPDRDIPKFVELYLDGQLPLEKLITHRYALADVNVALEDLERGTVGRPMIGMRG